MASQDSKLFEWHFTDLNHSDFHIYSRGLLLLLLFFSLIFTITIFSFHAYWACVGRLSTTTTSMAANSASSMHSHGLDAATIESLPVYLHRSVVIANPNAGDIEATEIECCICLGVFEGEEKVKVLPKCHHAYHSECVDKWLSVQSSCPLCRLSLRVINSL
ncbi:hypothetical protein PRUPE_6G053600 [Prunus persica]|uniref:RING-type E3 ubiquitin transferase n=1 Tax=Prunus persica TaxID=3760 RepID=M5W480_PRUPE|nr:hypothetical protein PRUPE_6G053600 [Prunus persica]